MKVIKFKNTSGVSDTWIGLTIADGAYEQLQSELDWEQARHDAKVNTDIWANDLVINDGVNDLAPSEANDYLNDIELKQVESLPKEFSSFYNNSTAVTTITAGTTVDIDLLLNQKATELTQLLFGGTLIASGHEFGDYSVFQVVDVDNVLGYGVGVVIKEYVRKAYINNDGHFQAIDHRGAELPVGLYLRCKYTSTGATDVKVVLNYDIRLML